MNLVLYSNTSDNNVVSKSITQLKSMTGTLREACSVTDPIIKVEGLTASQLKSANYAYISDFGRYYYINNIVCVGKLYELHMHVDVLMTYASGIRSQTAVISRQQNKSMYNLYLQDGVFKTYANPNYQIKQFPNGFDTQQFIFCVAG